MTPIALGRVRVLRKKKLQRLLDASQDPKSTTCSQCGLDIEPGEVTDVPRGIHWVVRYCLHCGHRSVIRVAMPNEAMRDT